MEARQPSIWCKLTPNPIEFTFLLDKETLAYATMLFMFTGLFLHWMYTKARPVYLLDFHCFKPPDRMKVPTALFMRKTAKVGVFTEESIDFQSKMLAKGGLGESTYLPYDMCSLDAPPTALNMQSARDEAELVMFTCVGKVLQENSLSANQVDILIVNCSLFAPTPSLAAMIINHFKMRPDIIAYNLSGMGCSAGIIAIALAQELLQIYPSANCLVMSTENITQNWYFGNQRSMLIPNCLFRVGGAAMLLSSRRRDAWRAKYKLIQCVRHHAGADDAAFKCVYQQADDCGNVGVKLSRDLTAVAGRALMANIKQFGHKVLPWSEKLKYVASLISRKLINSKAKLYVPKFQRAFEHFCLHTGGRGVIDEVQDHLHLTDDFLQPSRDTLNRYGNVSSSSIWYVLARIETLKLIRRGDKIWQLALGSGFKCNSAAWRAMRNINTQHAAWVD